MTSSARREQRFTYGDYLGWDEGRFELIDGELFDMSPAPFTAHQRTVGALYLQVGNHLADRGGDCEAFIAPFDVRLGETDDEDDEAASTVVQPDLVVICDPSKIDERGCRGAPDWVIEVSSPSTASKDQMQKRQLYERHGVREYWLVHPTDRTITIYRPDADGRYGAPDVADAKGTSPAPLLPGLEIDWSAVFVD